jgi:hypothetical protein
MFIGREGMNVGEKLSLIIFPLSIKSQRYFLTYQKEVMARNKLFMNIYIEEGLFNN